MEASVWSVSEASSHDREVWDHLYRAYAAGAGADLDDGHLDRVWSWILRPDGQTSCLLLRLEGLDGPVGLAHVRLFERPLAGSIGCHLDDLFVSPRARGRGGARALLRHLAIEAEVRGWSTVRWTTGVANPAQRLYDDVAQRQSVISYDMDPRSAR